MGSGFGSFAAERTPDIASSSRIQYDIVMIERFYVHNFRCLENFELPISGRASSLLIGRNGTGKSTIRLALEVLQQIGRGSNRVGELLKSEDFARALGRPDPFRD